MLPFRVIGVLCGCALQACAATPARPALSPSTDQPAHALDYPDRVAAALAGMEQDEAQARQHLAEFASYPEKLKSPAFQEAVDIVELADQEGRGEAFASAADRRHAVRGFLTEYDRQLGAKIAGSVNQATENNGCKEEVGAPAYYATKRSMDRQLTASLRERNAAQHAITERQASLGKRNERVLRDQVDAISMVSYTAHVGLDDYRRELEHLQSERSHAETTLERAAEQLRAAADDPQQPRANRETAKKQLAEVEASRERLAEQAPRLEQASQQAPSRVEALRKDYHAAFDTLVAELRRRAQAAPAR